MLHKMFKAFLFINTINIFVKNYFVCVCVCVCVCARVRARARACICVYLWSTSRAFS